MIFSRHMRGSMRVSTKSKKTETKRLDRYAGEWVVFADEKIVAHDKVLAAAMEEAEKQGVARRASVFLVPRKDEGPYALPMYGFLQFAGKA